MSFLGSIVSKILHPFGGSEAQAKPGEPTSSASAGVSPNAANPASGGGAASGEPAATGSTGSIDVEQNLARMAADNPQKLNWKTSIVDLLKLIDLDSSMSARQKLADELHYTGDKNDSATMNVWLHKQVMKKLEENGGKVPADLKD